MVSYILCSEREGRKAKHKKGTKGMLSFNMDEDEEEEDDEDCMCVSHVTLAVESHDLTVWTYVTE